MRFLSVLLVAVVALCAVATYAAPTDDKEVYIYKGESPSQVGLSLGGWGSGGAIETKEKVFTGTDTIKITTQSLYAGGKIEFSQPVALFSGGIDKSRYVVFTIYFPDSKVVNPLIGGGVSSDVEAYQIPKMSKVRFLFVSDAGTMLSAEEPTNPLDIDDNMVRIAVPLAKFEPLGVKEFKLKKLVLTGNIPGAFYLAEVRLVNDTAPIKVEQLDEKTVAQMDDVVYTALATGGVSSLKYSWDFDGNGKPEVADKIGHYIYTKGGDYDVSLTVSDVDGLKDPVTVKVKVTVND